MIPEVAPPPIWPVIGTSASEALFGSTSSDDIDDTAPGQTGPDYDSLFDSPMGMCGDGVPDTLDATDGDPNDNMSGGPEDTFKGDPCDWVWIWTRGAGGCKVLWAGKFEVYERVRDFVAFLKGAATGFVEQWLAEGGGAGVPPGATWHSALEYAVGQLEQGQSTVPSTGQFLVGQYFIPTLYVHLFDPLSLADPVSFLEWLPYDAWPPEDDADKLVSAEDFHAAIDAAQAIAIAVMDGIDLTE